MKRRLVSIALSIFALLSLCGARTLTARSEHEALGSRETCAGYDGLPEGFGTRADAGMVRVRGGTIVLGSTHGYRDEIPAGPTTVDDFYIDRTEVTNAQFAVFVRETGYVTAAELEGGAPIFDPGAEPTRAYGWWRYAAGASYAHPSGGDLRALPNEPVVQVTLADALAYARWLGRDLPTEAEWELAARAGRVDASLDRAPRAADGRPLANFWQGAFPAANTEEDGFSGRAPVGCFAANAFGLHDLIGNVWEWTKDPYKGSHREAVGVGNQGDRPPEAYVIKGGSFLCSPDFCARYRASARHRQEASMSGAHIGFRTVQRIQ